MVSVGDGDHSLPFAVEMVNIETTAQLQLLWLTIDGVGPDK
jgi:hypothetical protein